MSSTIRLSSTSPTSGSIATDTPTPRKRGRPKGSKRATTIQSSALNAINTANQRNKTLTLKDLLSRLFSSQSTLSIMHQESSEESPVLQGLVFQALLKFQDSISGPQEIHVDKEDVFALKELKTILEETETPFYKNSLAELFDSVITSTNEHVRPSKKLKPNSPLPSSPVFLPTSSTPSPSLSPLVANHIQTTSQVQSSLAQAIEKDYTEKLEAIEKAYNDVQGYLQSNSATATSVDYFDKNPKLFPKRYLKHFATDVIHYKLIKTSETLLNTNPRHYLARYFSDPKSIQLASLKESSLSLDPIQYQQMFVDFDNTKKKYTDFLNIFRGDFTSRNITIPEYRHTWPHFDPKTPPRCEPVGKNPMHAINFATLNYIIYQTSKQMLEQVKKDHPNIYQIIIQKPGAERTLFFMNIAFALLKKAEYYENDNYLRLETFVPSAYEKAKGKPEKLILKMTFINHDSFDLVNAYNFRRAPNEPYWAKKYLDTLTDEQSIKLYLQLRAYKIDEDWAKNPIITLLSQIAAGIEARYFFDFTLDPNTTPGPLHALLTGTDPAEIESKFGLALNLNSWAHTYRKYCG